MSCFCSWYIGPSAKQFRIVSLQSFSGNSRLSPGLCFVSEATLGSKLASARVRPKTSFNFEEPPDEGVTMIHPYPEAGRFCMTGVFRFRMSVIVLNLETRGKGLRRV